MSTWYERGVFYHMYPLGMTGAPRHNDATEVTNRFAELLQWIAHPHPWMQRHIHRASL